MRPGSSVAFDKSMTVERIDEAGQQRGFRQIYDGRAGGNLGGGCIGNTLDAIAVNDDHLVVPRLVGFAIDQRAGANDGKRFGGTAFFLLLLPGCGNHEGKKRYPRMGLHGWLLKVFILQITILWLTILWMTALWLTRDLELRNSTLTSR